MLFEGDSDDAFEDSSATVVVSKYREVRLQYVIK